MSVVLSCNKKSSIFSGGFPGEVICLISMVNDSSFGSMTRGDSMVSFFIFFCKVLDSSTLYKFEAGYEATTTSGPTRETLDQKKNK